MYSNTIKIPWRALRTDVAADDTPIAAFGYTSWPTSNTINGLHNDPTLKDANSLGIIAYGTDAEDEAITYYKLYGRAKQNGPIILLLTGVMTLGAQACPVNPITGAAVTAGFWVDTITVTGGLLEGRQDVLDSTGDMIAMLKWDNLFFDDLYLEIDMNTMATFSAILIGL